jgi:hypothetical protein
MVKVGVRDVTVGVTVRNVAVCVALGDVAVDTTNPNT